MAVGLGEERDGAQRRAMLLIELTRRVNEPHGGFTAIDDRYTFKFVLHNPPDQQITVTELHSSCRNGFE
jgi:hypothetical protein